METRDILSYVLHTPENINPAILTQMLGELGGGSENVSRRITLPEDSGFVNSNLCYDTVIPFIFAHMIPYLILEGISVKYKGEEITSSTYTEEHPPLGGGTYTVTLVTEENTYTIIFNVTGDGDMYYPTVDGKEVSETGLFSLDIGTEKYYVLLLHDEVIFEGLCDELEVLDIPVRQNGNYIDCSFTQQRGRDFYDTFPPILGDTFFN